MKRCPNCGTQINDDCVFCTECGKPIPQGNLCPNCGAIVAEGDSFCQNCGRPIPQGNICPHCGVIVEDGDSFCQNCGKKVGEMPTNDVVDSNQPKCPQCGAPVNEGSSFCENCGRPILQGNNCPHCGAILEDGDSFCQNCGKKINEHQVEIPYTENNAGKAYQKSPSFVQSSEPTQTRTNTRLNSTYSSPEVSNLTLDARQSSHKKHGILIGIIVFLAILLLCGIGGYLYYDKINLPEKIDRLAQQKSDSIANLKDSLNNIEMSKRLPKKHTTQSGESSAHKTSSINHTTNLPHTKVQTGAKNMGYANYEGTLVSGRPHGVNGRLTFKTPHQIDSRDPKGRIAEPGDYVIGEFYEGHLVQGIWYDAYNQVKGSIIIGR